MGGRQKIRLSLFFIALFVSPLAAALTYSETFTSRSAQDTSQLVWNIALGELHPPLWVENWSDDFGTYDTTFEVGDGRHGAFEVSTYANFGTVAGNVIEIDTDVHQDLQFTSFFLEENYTLRPVGSRPLVIRSLSTVVVNGIINCSGENGAAGTTNPNEVRPGGAGHCGGGDGGDSGITGVDGQDGGVGVTAGGGGQVGTASGGVGGGGGGGFVWSIAMGGPHPDPTAGVNPAGGAGGTVGSVNRDDSFDIDLSGTGGGGGGGSAFNDASDVPNHGSGGSGGAGGGNIRIYAVGDVTVGANGAIRARGGNGGDSNKAGAGGGGGGGSILIFSGGLIQLNGLVRATPGAGGDSLLGGDGGAGAVGRTWVVASNGFASGTPEVPETELNSPGDVRYQVGTFVAESVAIDFRNTQPTLTNWGLTLDNSGTGTGSALFEIDTDGVFADVTTLIGQTFNRFFKFRLSLTSNISSAPMRIRDISLEYDGHLEKEFEFKGACGTVTGKDSSSWTSLLYLLPVLLLGLLRLRLRELPLP